MTLQELIDSNRNFLTVEEVCSFAGIGSRAIRKQARTDPEKLGFPIVVAENTIRIPRLAFIRWYEGTNTL